MADLWYYAANRQKMGPVAREELHRLAASGELTATDLVWTEGMPEWIQAERVEWLFPQTIAAYSVTAESPPLSTPTFDLPRLDLESPLENPDPPSRTLPLGIGAQ